MAINEYDIVKMTEEIWNDHKRSFPINAFSIKSYAMAIHKSVQGKNIRSQMFEHHVTELEAKLIDSYLINHAQEIADIMFRDYFASVFDGIAIENTIRGDDA